MKKLGILFATVIMIMLFALSASANDNTYEVGDIIQFGSYPQTEVKDKSLISKLNTLYPEWSNWISYGYYSGTGAPESMMQGNWMKYTDISYNGEKYRAVLFLQYRPRYTSFDSDYRNSRQYNNGYEANKIYWFKFEPLNWKVLDPSIGLFLCDDIIDSQPYSNTVYYEDLTKALSLSYNNAFNDAFHTTYANDYETSSIREWLNNDFYNVAFALNEKNEISLTTLNNDGYYTSEGISGYEALDSGETTDKIFLLSYNEARSSEYGFNSIAWNHDTSRQAQGSDYAKCQGLECNNRWDSLAHGNSDWLLRTSGNGTWNSCCINDSGNIGSTYGVEDTFYGIRPALRVNRITNIGKDGHIHTYTSAVTKTATCTETGTKTFTCICGDTYTETIPATNHPNATTDEGKAPTATEIGYTAGKYCPDCKTWIEGHTEIPKLEEHKHSYAPTTTQEATCWREGVKTYTCACGDTYTEAIAKLEHEYRPWETKKKPTCTEPGLEWSYCLICDNDFEREIPAEGHNEYAYTRRATPAEAGAYVVACDKCWIEFSSVSFGRPAEYKLSSTTYTYNGKAKTPKLTVITSDGKVLTKGVDYTVELPKDRTSVGTHTYRVVFMGDYLGETKVSYQILPGKTSSVSASQSTDYIKLSWKKVTGATGYRVYQYNSSTGKYKTLKTLTGTSYTVKNLKAGTIYKFAVKAYTKANGETLWAASSKTLTTATKPATPTVKATAGAGKVTLSWSKVSGATGYVVYMMDEFGDYEKVGSTKGTSYTKKSLKKGKTYKFRVKAYKKVDGKYIYSGYKTYSVKVK